MEHEDKPYLFENNNILGRLKAVAPKHIFTGPIRVMAQRLGVSAQSWHDWSKPGHSLTQKNIERLKVLMGEWGLIREIQEWVIHEKNGLPFDKATKCRTRTPSDDPFVLVKRTSIEFAAGSGNVANYTEIEPVMFRQDWLRSKATSPKNIELATVSGNSMEPYIWAGDVIAFDRGRGVESVPIKRKNEVVRLRKDQVN